MFKGATTLASVIKQTFTKHPYLANSIVYGGLFFGAELCQQTVERKIVPEKSLPYDTAVFVRYTIYAATMQGPVLVAWYEWLDKKYVGTSMIIISKKLFMDQFVLTPPLCVSFYVFNSVLEGKEDIFDECRRKFGPTFAASCIFWIPAQAFNFFLLPTRFRVAYVGICSFISASILCWIKRDR